MGNLLNETRSVIEYVGQSVEAVSWVGTRDGAYAVTWTGFSEFAKSIDYNEGFGSAEIDGRLVVVFEDGSWLERWEYDGSEGWRYRIAPRRLDGAKPFTLKDHNFEYCVAEITGELVEKP